MCNHCTYPACLSSCPRGSIYKRPEDGIVLVDQERCRGYQECVKVCPYKKVFFNPMTGTSEKCIGCFPKIEEGFQQFMGARMATDPLHEIGGLHTAAFTRCVLASDVWRVEVAQRS